MDEQEDDRLRQLTTLTPRRFHISANPPFGIGFLIFGHENEDYHEDNLEEFFNMSDQIRNCKPGIWTSMTRELSDAEPDQPDRECILRWVCEGSIDLAQSVDDWKAYEEATRQGDAAVTISKIVPPGTKWRRHGSYFDDGGICTIVSTEYLTHKAARAIMFGDGDSDEELDFGYYLETLSLNGADIGVGDQEGLTIGGMNFFQDEVGSPPRIAVAEENGQVIAVRFFLGGEDWSSEGTEEGLESIEGDEEGME
ncbi:uncharacterized protein LY89DRAFT_713248 [Mollisia scopiformis]|uniref:Uncharacterized protein n=1 Tax=Mollisia scopiformis TaxID=149040 RepID=A0A194XVM9_MOLSC|nr:uncharacterized protein LY89DRAFT_713248 [Mollisia scopiformis]KUJ24385.1 hypothetical protein LY89DRAFT_713248 [Mollisia scopiformis]